MNGIFPRAAWLLAIASTLPPGTAGAQAEVIVIPAPHGGFRPRAVVDDDGVLHVVQADATSRGDLFYVRREPGSSEFSAPLRVNATRGIVAVFDMAVGAGGRVHVLMRTNPKYSRLLEPEKAKLSFFDLKYMLYARSNDAGDAFEPERNLAGATLGFEGGGAILADGERVLAFWHGQLVPEFDEPSRRIFRVESRDGGRTFTEPVAVEADAEGACQCCSLAGHLGESGKVLLTFRNSTRRDGAITKDSYVLVSEDRGKTFAAALLEPWEEAGCPGSIGSVTGGPAGAFVAWRTRGAVHAAKVGEELRISPTGDAQARLPQVVSNRRGELLFLWGETGAPGAKGAGDIVWQVFDGEGRAVSERGRIPNGIAERWGAPAACARPDGSFLILHDGEGR